jgi:hypothetical protein
LNAGRGFGEHVLSRLTEEPKNTTAQGSVGQPGMAVCGNTEQDAGALPAEKQIGYLLRNIESTDGKLI